MTNVFLYRGGLIIGMSAHFQNPVMNDIIPSLRLMNDRVVVYEVRIVEGHRERDKE